MRRSRLAISVFLLASLVGSASAQDAAVQDKAVQESIVPVFDFSNAMVETPDKGGFSLSGKVPKTLYDMLTRIERAADDEAVDAIVVTVAPSPMGWAQMLDVRSALVKAREKGKAVYCYSEVFDAKSYMLATAASRITMVPSGDLNITGVRIEQMFFKGLLDKLHVVADIESVGAYKGAAEPFMRTQPSDESKEMHQWLIKDLYDIMVETIADGRELSVEEVRTLIDKGPFRAVDALEADLIDELAYSDEFVASLKDEYGATFKLTHDYGKAKGPELDFSNIFSLFKSFGDMMKEAKSTGKASVAVVYVEGMIAMGKTETDMFGKSNSVGSTTLRRILDRIRNDKDIEAVVLRINSPGGSALASDIIWHAAHEVNEVKPVIVSMGDTAASGGYYIAAAGSTIFAEPSTITGSIGVVGGKVVTRGLWEDLLGVSFHETQQGKNADLYNALRPFSDEQRKQVRKYMRAVYAEFKDRVKQGRGDRIIGDLEALAGGRVYTGRQALAKGLVDELGGLPDAIVYAASEARLTDYDVQQFPQPQDFMTMFIKELSGETDDAEEGEVGVYALRGWTLESPAIGAILPLLETIDPQRARAVLRSLMRIELLGSETTLLVTPSEFLIR